MNQQTGYTQTSRGWGVPFLGIVMGVMLVLGAAWVILADLFRQVGSSASAVIVILSATCGVSGVLLALVVVAIVHSIREPRPVVLPQPQASYEVLPAMRAPPVLLPASNRLTRFQSSAGRQAELRFKDQPPRYVPLAAVEAVAAMDVIKRPPNWPHANKAYGDIKEYAVANHYAQAADGKAGTWVDKPKFIALLREWQRR